MNYGLLKCRIRRTMQVLQSLEMMRKLQKVPTQIFRLTEAQLETQVHDLLFTVQSSDMKTFTSEVMVYSKAAFGNLKRLLSIHRAVIFKSVFSFGVNVAFLKDILNVAMFLTNEPITASFCLFSFFSRDKYSTNWTKNDKSIDGVLETQTRGGRMVCLGLKPGVAGWWAQINPLSCSITLTQQCFKGSFTGCADSIAVDCYIYGKIEKCCCGIHTSIEWTLMKYFDIIGTCLQSFHFDLYLIKYLYFFHLIFA